MVGMHSVYFVDDSALPYFPVDLSPDEYGLVAVGGRIAPPILLEAYRKGIFPWYDETPVLWFSPDPRLILTPETFRLSKSLRRVLRRGEFSLSVDTCFEKVLTACAMIPRAGQDGTWITSEMATAYVALHDAGITHSVEVFLDGELCGGLYGVALGTTFFGESMFSLVPNASKIAACGLCCLLATLGYNLIDCQVHTPHLESLGAVEITRADFLTRVSVGLRERAIPPAWPLGKLVIEW